MAYKRQEDEQFIDGPCYACKRLSCGIAWQESRYDKLKHVCEECKNHIMSLREVRNFTRLEIDALPAAVDRAAEYLHEELGGLTDLSKMTDIEARMFCKHVLLGFGDKVRELAETGKY